MLALVKDTRCNEILEEDIDDDPIQGTCYLCGETVFWGEDYQVHLVTAHEEVHVTSVGHEGKDDVIEDDGIKDKFIEDKVIEDSVACYLCGESVLPGQDYKVHLTIAHKLTQVENVEIDENTALMWLERTRQAELVDLEVGEDNNLEVEQEKKHTKEAGIGLQCEEYDYRSKYAANLQRHMENMHQSFLLKRKQKEGEEKEELKRVKIGGHQMLTAPEENEKEYSNGGDQGNSKVGEGNSKVVEKRKKKEGKISGESWRSVKRAQIIQLNPKSSNYIENITLPLLLPSSESEKTYSCNDCPKTFKRSKHFYRHKSSVHSNIVFSCEKCETNFSRSDHLARHRSSVHSNIEISCNKCDKQFSRRDKMNVHMGRVH